jgi:hypothetical protein
MNGYKWFYSPLLGPGLFFNLLIIFTQTVGLLGRVISPLQCLYLHIKQHKHGINAHTDNHALSEISTDDLNVRANEDSTCLKSLGHRDRPVFVITSNISCSLGPVIKTASKIQGASFLLSFTHAFARGTAKSAIKESKEER